MQRTGSTLVELMLSMTAGSTIMLLAISLVHQTMTLTEKSNFRSDHQRKLDLVGERFRRDVHLAESVSQTIGVSVDDTALTLVLTDHSEVSYSAIGNTIVRQSKNSPNGNEFDRFVLDPSSAARVQVTTSPDRAVLTVLSQTGINERPTKLELVVRTIVGKWKSLEGRSPVLP